MKGGEEDAGSVPCPYRVPGHGIARCITEMKG